MVRIRNGWKADAESCRSVLRLHEHFSTFKTMHQVKTLKSIKGSLFSHFCNKFIYLMITLAEKHGKTKQYQKALWILQWAIIEKPKSFPSTTFLKLVERIMTTKSFRGQSTRENSNFLTSSLGSVSDNHRIHVSANLRIRVPLSEERSVLT